MKTIEKEIPSDFVEMVKAATKSDVKNIVLSHLAFDIEESEMFGKSIKYACMNGLDVSIVGS
jgi:hypothetical protein